MPHSQRVVVRIKKGKDGRTALSCVRDDGSTTWQRQQGGRAAFFPKHDLTHYAVESTLALRQGFYGLIAAGWDFSDFGSPWPRGRLPIEANISEMVVGFLDLERTSGERRPVTEINQAITEFSGENGLSPFPMISEEDLAKIRETRAQLFASWDAVRGGEALEISFDAE
jgi:hypothetical protein